MPPTLGCRADPFTPVPASTRILSSPAIRLLGSIRQRSPGNDDPADQCEPAKRLRARWRWRPGSRGPHRRAYYDQRPEGQLGAAAARVPASQVDSDASHPEATLDHEGCRNGIPQAQTEPGRWARPERHVGGMTGDIEDPVADDQSYQEESGGARHPEPAGQASQRRAPHDRHDQTMRPGVGVEDQRREGGRSRNDADALDAGKDQDRPDQVQGSHPSHEPAKVHAGYSALGRKSESQVTDEQGR